jgi:hypothetical protein
VAHRLRLWADCSPFVAILIEVPIKTRRERRALTYWLWAISLSCFIAAGAVPYGAFFRWEILVGILAALLGGVAIFYGKKKRRRKTDYRKKDHRRS